MTKRITVNPPDAGKHALMHRPQLTEPFRWKNLSADIHSFPHLRVVQEFHDQVIEPSLAALEAQMALWAQDEEPAAAFMVSDCEDLRRATTMAFCLSIQSLWERQIRGYLIGCAKELEPDDASLLKKVISGPWSGFSAIFERLRGIPLTAFDSYLELDFLQLLANACRHGDGPSAVELWKLHPELWPETSIQLWDKNEPAVAESSPIDQAVVSHELLTRFVRAIVEFWSDMEYIYNESITVKHWSLKKRLSVERQQRALSGKGPWQA